MKYLKSFVVLCCLAQLLLIGGSDRLLARDAASEGLGLTTNQAKKLDYMMSHNIKHATDQKDSKKIAEEGGVSAANRLKVLKYFNKSVEVVTSFNPLKITNSDNEDWKKWTSVGQLIADGGKLRNIHEVHMSDVGRDDDSPKRALTEIASFHPRVVFWPSKTDYWDAVKCTHAGGAYKNKADMEKLFSSFNMEEDAILLPKYGALNYLARWDGVLKGIGGRDNSVLTFAYKQRVKNRMTITANDSLQMWLSGDAACKKAKNAGLIKNDGHCPDIEKNDPWGMGPKGVFDTDAQGDKDYLFHVLNYRKEVKEILNFLNNQENVIKSGLKVNSSRSDTTYIEAQIHGPVNIERDVQRVYANFFLLFGHPHFEKLYKYLLAKKIDIIWYYQAVGRAGNTLPDLLIQENGEEPGRMRSAWKTAKSEYNAKFKVIKRNQWRAANGDAVPKGTSAAETVPKLLSATTIGHWNNVAKTNAADRNGLLKKDGRAWVGEYISTNRD
ncbi:MAG: DUF3626 domain-containing protein [bacterium]|nr:DUF3626 domain-containing protein [bacterium]